MPRSKRAGPRSRIVLDPEIRGGRPAIEGSHVTVEEVLQRLADRPDLSALLQAYPELTAEDVRAALAYARAVVSARPVPSLGGTPAEQGITLQELLASAPIDDAIALREYRPEQVAQFLKDDVLTGEEQATVERFRREPAG